MRGDIEHVLPGQRRSGLFEHVRGRIGGDVADSNAAVARIALGQVGFLPVQKILHVRVVRPCGIERILGVGGETITEGLISTAYAEGFRSIPHGRTTRT